MEGSYETNSPYVGTESENLYYLGVGNYFGYENALKNLDTGEIENFEEYEGAAFTLKKVSAQLRSGSVPDNHLTHVNADQYRVINNDWYFKNLKQNFPKNEKGTCALTALCMLLGYWYYFGNWQVIPYADPPYTAGVSDIVMFANQTNEKILEQMNVKNIAQMPGTTDAFRDLFFNNYMHTVLGIRGEGYPMAATELELTMRDYRKGELTTDVSNALVEISGALFYTHAKPKELIDRGVPCLIISKYHYFDGEKQDQWHTMLAYGYRDDKFLVHYGWKGRPAVIVTEATIHSYYTLEYRGIHVHTKFFGAKEFLGNRVFEACACGKVWQAGGGFLN